MITPFDYRRRLEEIETEVLRAVKRVLHSNRLILGPETENFETEFATLTGAKHSVGVSSGTSAIQLALATLGIGHGDEVITVSNTCTPTISAIRVVGATPVFVDVRESDLVINPELITSKITSETRCILPVHLYGNAADMAAILRIASQHNLAVVEDCAQAHGTKINGQPVGTFGDIGCFSFYPTKNIGAYGDAGAAITNDSSLSERLKRIRMYGYDDSGQSQEEGTNVRINEIQAAILRIKISKFPEWFQRRLQIAAIYDAEIANPSVIKPDHSKDCSPSYHQYVIRSNDRDTLKSSLLDRSIATGIHYPVPVHLMPAYTFLGGDSLDLPVTTREAGRILSLPVHDGLNLEEAHDVAAAVNAFSSSNA